MKEFISNINPEDYHSVVYPSLVGNSPDMVMQPTLDGDILIVPNEEKYPYIAPVFPPVKEKINPLQMPFIRKP